MGDATSAERGSRSGKPARLSDIAARLDLSTSSVSLALRDSPRIPPATRAEVRRIAGELGYVYNRQAAELRRGVRTMVGVCINDLDNPLFLEWIRYIEIELQNHDLRLLLWNASEDVEKQRQFLTTLQEYGAAGVLICPAQGTTVEEIDAVDSERLPMTCFSRTLPGSRVPGFASDDERGAFEAVRHLSELGHRRIGWIGGGHETSTSQARFAGYRTGVEQMGAEDDPALRHYCETSRSAGYAAATALLDDPRRPTALVAFGDLVAIGAAAACRERGLRVGIDISIVGHDDIDSCQYTEPPLTTVALDKPAIARAAVANLAARIRDPNVASDGALFAPHLVVRSSTGPRP